MGRPPKHKQLHVLQGTYRQDRHGKKPAPPPTMGELTAKDCPDFLDRPAKMLWNEYVGKLTWLTHFDVQTFAIWCALQSEFQRDPDSMTSARLNQLRLVAGEIGLTATGRARMGISTEQPVDDENPAAKYFR